MLDEKFQIAEKSEILDFSVWCTGGSATVSIHKGALGSETLVLGPVTQACSGSGYTTISFSGSSSTTFAPGKWICYQVM